MPIIKETTTTWVCDACKKAVAGNRKPNSPQDPWGYLSIDQDAGFDAGGHPWVPRMREPVLLCGKCIDKVMGIIKGGKSNVETTR